jgi:sugar-specific transcriptional regulator TrmB
LEDDLTQSRKEAENLAEKLNQTEMEWEMKYNYMENDLNNAIDEGKETINSLQDAISGLNDTITRYF